MLEHCDFTEQPTSTTEDGVLLRPDLVVHLAGGKNVVVDSKVAFTGFLEASEARDEATREARLKAHARHLRTHVDQLAAKAYWERFDPSPEFVVCFVPADVFLDAALQQEPALLEHAFERNVVIATPSTLVAMLRTVGYAWRQEALARNAREVHELAREFYTRLATMGGHVDAVGTRAELGGQPLQQGGQLAGEPGAGQRAQAEGAAGHRRRAAGAAAGRVRRARRWRRRCWSPATRSCRCPGPRNRDLKPGPGRSASAAGEASGS